MDATLMLVLISVILLFLIFPLLFFLRKNVELRLEEDVLILDYPVTTKKIELNKELESWQVQEAYYFRWGIFHAVNLKFKNEKRVTVSSLLNQKNFDLIFNHLNTHHPHLRAKDIE